MMSSVRSVRYSLGLKTYFHRSLSNFRQHKSIQETLNRLSATNEKLKPQTFTDIIDHHEKLITAHPVEEEINQIYELVSALSDVLEADSQVHDSSKNDFYNSVIRNFSKYDFASSNVASNKLSALEPLSLIEIIKYNPGRVASSWEYFNKFGKDIASLNDELHVEVLKKLVYGDKVDIMEGTSKLDVERAIKAIRIIKDIKDQSNIPSTTMLQFITDLIELKLSPFILLLKPDSNTIIEIAETSQELTNWDYLYIWKTMDAEQQNSLIENPKVLLDFLRNISLSTVTEETLSEEYVHYSKQLDLPAYSLDSKYATEQITDLIKENKLDRGKEILTSQIRLVMLRAAGFYCGDLKTTLELYTRYQLEAPNPSVHLYQLQSLVSSIVVHHAIAINDPSLLSFAEVLVPQIPSIPSSNTASFILYHAWFGDMDRSLEIYNKSLNSFMSNEVTENGKNRGTLIQSLILCAVLENDLELAQFIKSKAKENQLYGEEYDIKINQNLKDYGDLVEITPDKKELRSKVGKMIERTIRDAAFC